MAFVKNLKRHKWEVLTYSYTKPPTTANPGSSKKSSVVRKSISRQSASMILVHKRGSTYIHIDKTHALATLEFNTLQLILISIKTVNLYQVVGRKHRGPVIQLELALIRGFRAYNSNIYNED